MNSAEVVMDGVQSNRVAKVVHLLAETIGKPRESPHLHLHRQVLALDKAGRNVIRIGTSHDDGCLRTDAFRRAIPDFLAFVRTVNLDQCGVVNLASECALDRRTLSLLEIGHFLTPWEGKGPIGSMP